MALNERAREEWIERTDGFERVRTTLETTTEPASASDIAERAAVSEKTARKYLQRMVDLGVAETEQDGRTTLYHRDAANQVFRRIDELLADHTRQELVDAIQQMREEVLDYRRAHGVDTAEELAVSLSSGDPDGAWHALSEWRTVERNLAIAQAALAVERAVERFG